MLEPGSGSAEIAGALERLAGSSAKPGQSQLIVRGPTCYIDQMRNHRCKRGTSQVTHRCGLTALDQHIIHCWLGEQIPAPLAHEMNQQSVQPQPALSCLHQADGA